MQPYPNPNYFNQYQQMQNPYMDRMSQLQQYQQSLQQPMSPAQIPGTNQQMNVIGKIVDSIDVVKATDVPMDGNIYYFPKADGTEIFAKQWQSNGTTRILTFKPFIGDDANIQTQNEEKVKIDLSDDVTKAFMDRFDNIESKIEEIISKSKNTRQKKEAD